VIVARPALERLDQWLHDHDVTGWDPYDGLASPVARLAKGRWLRQATVQVIKRAPEGTRKLLGVPQHRLTKALALVAVGLGGATWLPDAEVRRDRLISEICEHRGADAWGYEFDVQTRWGYYPAGSPNAIVTAFAVEAVAGRLEKSERAAIVKWLTGPMWADGYFRYVAGNNTLVHNASMLSARALELLEPGHPHVAEAIRTSTRGLPDGGIWPYGEDSGLAWVDNFHTGYVIAAFLDLEPAYPEVTATLDVAVRRYFTECFSPTGEPYYYAGGTGPVDIHNIASAVGLTQRLAGTPRGHRDVAARCLQFALGFQRGDGAFVPHPRAVPFVRWNQAHMHRALCEVTR
jgi:hypothetical protein